MPRSWGNCGFGYAPFGHTDGISSPSFGIGPWTVFVHTPGYVHGEEVSYAVQVNRFQDASEQRYLLGGQRGLLLQYEFHFVDCGTIVTMNSFFLAAGTFGRFWMLDHRTGTTHLARYGLTPVGPTVTAPLQRDFALQFITEQPNATGMYGTHSGG